MTDEQLKDVQGLIRDSDAKTLGLLAEIAELEALLRDGSPRGLAKKAKLAQIPLSLHVRRADEGWVGSVPVMSWTLVGKSADEIVQHACREISKWQECKPAELSLHVQVDP